MATRRNPRFKECRRLGVNVCGHPKALKRVDSNTNVRRRKPSEYSLQLTEKQKIKAYYGLFEKQLHRYFEKARRMRGVTGDNLFRLLESRLDNMVYRIGLANSIRQARQMVTHGHILVNGKKIDIPSYLLTVGDEVALLEKSQKNSLFSVNFTQLSNYHVPYVSVNKDKFSGKFDRLPLREEVPVQIHDESVIAYYSK